MLKDNTNKENTNWKTFLDWHVHQIKSRCIELCIPFKDYLEFPVAWNRSMLLEEYMALIYENYIKEIGKYLGEDAEIANKAKVVCDEINQILRKLTYPNTERDIFDLFDSLFNEICRDETFTSNDIKKGQTFYRLRCDSTDLVSEVNFYHVPFDVTYLCGTCRFSVPGQPALYLGYSKQVCIDECGVASGSIAQFKSKEDIKVVDLTLRNPRERLGKRMFYLWPFLAACYVEVPRGIDKELGRINYRAEYVFPQAFANYLIIKHPEIKGIVYYTVRNKFLIPEKSDNNNVVLFTDKESSGRYDMNLMKMFDIVNIGNV